MMPSHLSDGLVPCVDRAARSPAVRPQDVANAIAFYTLACLTLIGFDRPVQDMLLLRDPVPADRFPVWRADSSVS